MTTAENCVAYEDFGAVGNGVADDLPAICKAHAHANELGLKVVARPDACYHLGRQALTAQIATDTDWNTARFTVDDRDVEDHRCSLFEIVSLLQPIDLPIGCLSRDQKILPNPPQQDCFVIAEMDSRNLYIRRGLNQNEGDPQHDCFIVRSDGSIEGDIDWEYDQVTKVMAQPIDEQQLQVRGGVFTTHANCMRREVGYSYWARNIEIKRSRTIIDGLTHYVVDETEFGHPYRGFLSASKCADIMLKDCFVTGHKIYKTIGSAGLPVSMGSYDLHANDIVNFTLKNCTMNHITDRTRWGIIGSNFCKNILLEDCVLSRMDTHMGVSGHYTIRRCTLGYMGINAIGRGHLLLEDSTLYGYHLVVFRGDYGSTWEGDVSVRNCRWVPACGNEIAPELFGTANDGMHDFGYPCFMPRQVYIDGLHVDDSHVPEAYAGPCVFTPTGKSSEVGAVQPFPYQECETVTVKNVTSASGKALRVSADARISAAVEFVQM